MLQRILLAILAGAVFATSAAVATVALAFALYALVEPYVGRSGAAAIVVGAAAVLMGALAFALRQLAHRRSGKGRAAVKGSPIERVTRFVREQPAMAAAAALGAGFMAVRNPRYLGSTLRAFFEPRDHRAK